jgi:ketosteroid isomerase-like protein
MRTLLAVAAIVCLPATAWSQSAALEKSSDKVMDELVKRRENLERVAMARDVEMFLTFWAPDVRVREPGLALEGDQFVAFVRDFFKKGQVTLLDIRPARVFVHGETVYEFGEYDENALMDGQTVSIKNNYALRWRRMPSGAWAIDQFLAGARDN